MKIPSHTVITEKDRPTAYALRRLALEAEQLSGRLMDASDMVAELEKMEAHGPPPSLQYPALILACICTVVMDMIVEHHKTPEGIVGGLLHVQLDDGNLDDCFWEDPFSQEVEDIWERPPTQLETCIAALMKALPLHLRETVYEGAWKAMREGGISG